MKNKVMNRIELNDFEADLFCPFCGECIMKVPVGMTGRCEHLRYAGCSEAPGMPEFMDARLGMADLDTGHEMQNVETVLAAFSKQTILFQVGDCSGYIDMYLVFEFAGDDCSSSAPL